MCATVACVCMNSKLYMDPIIFMCFGVYMTLALVHTLQVHAMATPAGRVLFKALYSDYKRVHKYRGEA